MAIGKARGRAGEGEAPISAGLPGARRAPLPAFVEPQLATLVERPPAGSGWVHELKLDGYRILARVERGAAQLISRKGRDWTAEFPAVARAAAELPAEAALLDGELCVVLPDGRTSFQAMQETRGDDPRLHYFVFDLLHLDGWDLTQAPLRARKAALADLVRRAPRPDGLLLSGHVDAPGDEVHRRVCELGAEGVVSKRADAPYRPGRGADWLKTKCKLRQELVIGGFTDPAPGRVGLGALLLGVYEGERLIYAGRVGTGMADATLRDLRARLDRIRREESPFADKVTGRSPARARWVEPVLVAEVELGEWTRDGRIRHASFQGLREDRPAREVVRERAAAPEEVAGGAARHA